MTIEKTGTYRDLRLSLHGTTLRLRYSQQGAWVLRWDGGSIISKHDSRAFAVRKAKELLRELARP